MFWLSKDGQKDLETTQKNRMTKSSSQSVFWFWINILCRVCSGCQKMVELATARKKEKNGKGFKEEVTTMMMMMIVMMIMMILAMVIKMMMI